MSDASETDAAQKRDWVIRKGGYFYRPNCSGYTTDIGEAGRYTEKKARAEAAVEPDNIRAAHESEFPPSPLQCALNTIEELRAQLAAKTTAGAPAPVVTDEAVEAMLDGLDLLNKPETNAKVRKALTAAFAHLGGERETAIKARECAACKGRGGFMTEDNPFMPCHDCEGSGQQLFTDAELHKYGWAPGNYIIICSICKKQEWNNDKRSISCRPCAIKAKRSADASRADKPVGRESDDPAVAALAEAWASIDGKLDHFRRERDDRIPLTDPTSTGHHEGYLADAGELIKRLQTRGFVVCAAIDTLTKPEGRP